MNKSFVAVRRSPLPARAPWLTRRRVALAAGLLLLLLIAFLAYALMPDQQMAKVKQLRAAMNSEASRNLSPEQRREKFEEYRREVEKLSSAQRAELGREQQQRFFSDLDRFFKISKKEQMSYMDSQIDRGEAARKRFEQQRAGGARAGQQGGQVSFSGQGGSGRGTGGGSAEDRERRRKERLDNTTPQQREQMDLYRKMMDQRRRERGLPMSPLGRRA